jgi:hypothetical protein
MAYTRINWKNKPRTNTPINATNLNVMDSAIYDLDSITRYISPTLVTAADLKITILGTLATGQIIKLIVPSIVSTSAARLSIDNGTTYKDIVYENAVASIGTDISGKYITMYYNGTNWIVDVGEKVLYDNGTTGTYGAITLAETAANFKYITIFSKNNDNEFISTEVYSPDGKSVTLVTDHKASSFMYIKAEQIAISGTALIRGGAGEARIGNSVATVYSTGDKIIICRIIGFRK